MASLRKVRWKRYALQSTLIRVGQLSSALTLIAHSRLAYYVRAFPLLAQHRSRLDAIGRPLPTIELTEWMLTQSRS